jgi:putative acetyltransferase
MPATLPPAPWLPSWIRAALRQRHSMRPQRRVATVTFMQIRPERLADYGAIARLDTLTMGENEARLVELIRASDYFVPDLALVAEEESQILGHIVLSYVELLATTTSRVLALAPMAVKPERQRSGIGGSLIEVSLERSEAMDEPIVLVLGHSSYYPRFGFEPARPYGIEPPWPDLPDDVWMMKRLSSYSPDIRGTVRYPPAFDVTQ